MHTARQKNQHRDDERRFGRRSQTLTDLPLAVVEAEGVVSAAHDGKTGMSPDYLIHETTLHQKRLLVEPRCEPEHDNQEFGGLHGSHIVLI